MSRPPLGIAIPTWRGGALLARAIASLRAQAPAHRIEVVVSNPRGVPLPEGVTAPAPETRLHFAEAANRALRALRGHDVLILNDDAALQPGALGALLAARGRHGAGIYQPRILLDDQTGRLDNTGHLLFFDGFNVARGRGRPAEPPPPSGEVGAFSGAAALLCREVLDAVGLFDEDLGAFGEDLDLSLRARRAGFRIRLVPEARVHHRLGASYGRADPRKVYWVERNRVRAALRSLPATAVASLPLWTAHRLLWTGAAAAAGRGMGSGVGPLGAAAALGGLAAGALHAPGALRKRAQDRPGWKAGEAEMWSHLWRNRARPTHLWSQL